MAGVKRLLLVLMKLVKSDLIDEYGLTGFVTGKPIPVKPLAWNPESGLSHYGYALDGLKLKDLPLLEKFEGAYSGVTVHRFERIINSTTKKPGDLESVEQVLRRIGAEINQLALDDELPEQ